MARRLFTVDRGFRMVPENGGDANAIDIIFGTGAPGGDGDYQDAANPGSFYFRDDSPYGAYKKTGTADAAGDWEEVGNVSLDQLDWRNEKVRFATNDTLTAGTFDITTLTDNDDMVIGDITVGEYALGDVNGTPSLFEITAKPSGDQITIAAASQAIANNNTFMVQQYLPDPSSQEGQSIVHFPLASGAGVKVSDVNWNFADGVFLASSYAAVNGTISSADSVNSAIEKLDGNQQDLQTLSGVSQGDTDLGTFTGNTIADNRNNKEAFQDLETALEELRIIGKTTGITAATNVDAVLVDDVHAVEYEIVAWEEATPANKIFAKYTVMHNGTASADANDTDDSVHTKLSLGSSNSQNFLQLSTVLNGSGVAQEMRLTVASNTAGLTVEWRRSSVPVQ